MTFVPISESHALDSIEFKICMVRPFLPHEIDRLHQKSDRWREKLPAFRATSAPVQIGAQTRDFSGMVYSFLRPNGVPTWAFQVVGREVTVTCNLYTRWDPVWKQAEKYLQAALEASFDADDSTRLNAIELVSMNVTDRFTCDTDKYDAAALFEKSNYTPDFLFDSGPSWHIGSGWFEPHEGTRYLHNLKLESIEHNESKICEVEIDHYIRGVLDDLNRSEPFDEADYKRIENIFSSFHNKNKNILRDILTIDAQSGIGLRDNGDSHDKS